MPEIFDGIEPQMRTDDIVIRTRDGRDHRISPADYAALINASLDHGALLGLADDDHAQYALLAGRAGGQTLKGGTAAADLLRLIATSGVGAGAEAIIFQTGNNGGTESGRFTPLGLAVTGITTATTGYRVNNLAPSGQYIRGDGTNGVYSAIQSGDLPAVSREIPIIVIGTTPSSGTYSMPDEVATNFVVVNLYVPSTWDGSTNITLTTLWFADNTGLVDLETEIIYRTEVDENAVVVVQAFTNSNLTWAAANTVKTLTTTLSSLAAGRHYRVRFRRNTGDANTGTLFFQSARAVTAIR